MRGSFLIGEFWCVSFLRILVLVLLSRIVILILVVRDIVLIFWTILRILVL